MKTKKNDTSVKTVYSLISAYQKAKPEGFYFDSDTLDFWGEKVSEMRLGKELYQVIDDYDDSAHWCYRLTTYQRDPFTNGKRLHVVYFDVDTFEDFTVND